MINSWGINILNTYVYQYAAAKSNLLNYFNCGDDFNIKLCTAHHWQIEQNDGVYFLKYWIKNTEPVSAVIVKKDGEPLIEKADDLTMVIAIDCIKTAFILNNNGMSGNY